MRKTPGNEAKSGQRLYYTTQNRNAQTPSQREKRITRLLDALMILGIAFSITAHIITQTIATKSITTAVVYETNPAQRATNPELQGPLPGQERTSNWNFLASFLHMLILGLTFGTYLALRSRPHPRVSTLCICVGIWWTLLAFDLAGNLGILLGLQL